MPGHDVTGWRGRALLAAVLCATLAHAEAPPAPVVFTPPHGALLNEPRPQVTGMAAPGTRLTVLLEGEAVGDTEVDGSGAWRFTPPSDLSEGLHVVSARATNALDESSPEASPHTFTLDFTTPDTTLVSGPPPSSDSTSATFDFDTTEPGSSYECRLDEGAFSPCPDPVGFTDLAEGVHTLEVRARDPAGNVDRTPASATWQIALVTEGPPPSLLTLTTPAPGSVILDTSPTYAGAAGARRAVLVRREDGTVVCTTTADASGAWSCVEPTSLAQGPHTVIAVSGGSVRTTFTVTRPVSPTTPPVGGSGDGEPGTDGPADRPAELRVYGRGCSSTGSASSPWLAALLLLVPWRRAGRARCSPRAPLRVLALAVLATPRAEAQTTDPALLSQGIDVQRYKPGPGATDLLGVQGARVGQGWHLGASLSYAHNPLGFFDARQEDFVFQVVSSQLTLELMGSVSACERFELGVALPLTYQASERSAAPPAFAEGVTGAGLGDLRMVPKLRLVSTGGLHLGFSLPVLLPTAGARAFRGGTGVAVQPQVLGEWASSGGVRLLANLGIHLRSEARLLTLLAGPEWLYALGAHVPLGERLALQAQLAGALGLRERDAEERPLELLAAVQYRVGTGLRAHVGGGPGLTRGYGTPGFRVFAGLDWSPPAPAPR